MRDSVIKMRNNNYSKKKNSSNNCHNHNEHCLELHAEHTS